tara:strand:- start:261 stop:929 length:669 start_codon:yes stop_codon:yes gene_type:complete
MSAISVSAQVAKTLFASAGTTPMAILPSKQHVYTLYPELSDVVRSLKPSGKASRQKLKGDFATAIGVLTGFNLDTNPQWLNVNFIISDPHEDKDFISCMEAIARENGCDFRGSMRLSRFKTDIRGNDNTPVVIVKPIFEKDSSETKGDLCTVIGYEKIVPQDLNIGSLIKVNCSSIQFYIKDEKKYMSMEMEHVVAVIKPNLKRNRENHVDTNKKLQLPKYY